MRRLVPLALALALAPGASLAEDPPTLAGADDVGPAAPPSLSAGPRTWLGLHPISLMSQGLTLEAERRLDPRSLLGWETDLSVALRLGGRRTAGGTFHGAGGTLGLELKAWLPGIGYGNTGPQSLTGPHLWTRLDGGVTALSDGEGPVGRVFALGLSVGLGYRARLVGGLGLTLGLGASLVHELGPAGLPSRTGLRPDLMLSVGWVF